MSNLKINFSNINIEEKKIMSYAKKVTDIHKNLHQNIDKKEEFLGWLDLPNKYDKNEVEKINKCAKEIRRKSRYFYCNWYRWFIFRSKSYY